MVKCVRRKVKSTTKINSWEREREHAKKGHLLFLQNLCIDQHLSKWTTSQIYTYFFQRIKEKRKGRRIMNKWEEKSKQKRNKSMGKWEISWKKKLGEIWDSKWPKMAPHTFKTKPCYIINLVLKPTNPWWHWQWVPNWH